MSYFQTVQLHCTQTKVENLPELVEIWPCILWSLTENLIDYGTGLLFCCFGVLTARKVLSSLS